MVIKFCKFKGGRFNWSNPHQQGGHTSHRHGAVTTEHAGGSSSTGHGTVIAQEQGGHSNRARGVPSHIRGRGGYHIRNPPYTGGPHATGDTDGDHGGSHGRGGRGRGGRGRGGRGRGGRGRGGRFAPYPSQVVIILYSYLIIYI